MAFELDATFRTADGASRWLRRSAGRAGTARSATHGTMILKHRQSALMDRCVKPARDYIILAWRCQTSYACEGLSTVRRTDQGSSDWTRASPAHRTRGPRWAGATDTRPVLPQPGPGEGVVCFAVTHVAHSAISRDMVNRSRPRGTACHGDRLSPPPTSRTGIPSLTGQSRF